MNLEAEILQRLMAFRERLGPQLAAAFDALVGRLGLFRGRDEEGYFSHPMALPVLELPQWAAAHAARQGAAIPSTVVTALVEASAVGYLHVRVQDDWFDEEIGESHAAMMLSDALFARGLALLAPAIPPGGSAFWDLFEEVWVRYGEAMVLERRLQKGGEPYDVAAFRKVLARSHPLLLPAAAVLFAAGRVQDVEVLGQFAAALAEAHQLFADLLDVEKDQANANRTHVLYRLGGKVGGDREVAALRMALFGQGGFDAVVRDALEELARARRAAASLAMPEALRFLDRRERFMEEVQTKVFEVVFARAKDVIPDALRKKGDD